MKIDISNYEQYVIDYLEGALEGELRAEFEAFLLRYPDVAVEIESISEASLSLIAPDHAMDTSALKLNIDPKDGLDEKNYEEHFALAVDTDLNPQWKERVETFVGANEFLREDWKLYQKTKLSPDASTVIYEGKGELKKPVPIALQLGAYVPRVAAAAAVLLGVLTWFSMEDQYYSPRQAMLETSSIGLPVEESINALKNATQVSAAEPVDVVRTPRETAVMASLPLPVNPKIESSWKPTAVVDRKVRPEPMYFASAEPAQTIQPRQRAEEMNIAQYVGKTFLGVAPEKTPTTKALIKESAMKVIPRNDQFAIHQDAPDNDKKTFEILAGVFEFKRVTYSEE